MRKIALWVLVLPDGKIVFQRRAKDAAYAPSQLGFFGGHLDEGETHERAALRELQEETSLDIAGLPKKYLTEVRITASDNDDALFYMYQTNIPDAKFEVYEGNGSEVYSRDEALRRDDLSDLTRRVLTEIWKG